MKRIMTIFGVILSASFILTGYVGNNQDLKEKATKDSRHLQIISKLSYFSSAEVTEIKN